MAVCDQKLALDYYRLSSDNRMLFGGLCNYSGRDPVSIAGALKPHLDIVFPYLKDLKIEYQWGGTTGAYADNWGATTNPWNWGAGQSGVNPNQTIYVRAKASCGSNVAYSDPVAVDWLTCYGGATEIATSTSSGEIQEQSAAMSENIVPD